MLRNIYVVWQPLNKRCSREVGMSTSRWFLCYRWVRFLRTRKLHTPWWRHQMETFSALLALCAGNSPVPVNFPAQRPVTRSFDVFFHLRLNKRLSKQPWGWWFETAGWSLWRHRNDYTMSVLRTITPSVKSSVTTTLLGVEGVRTGWQRDYLKVLQGKLLKFLPDLNQIWCAHWVGV